MPPVFLRYRIAAAITSTPKRRCACLRPPQYNTLKYLTLKWPWPRRWPQPLTFRCHCDTSSRLGVWGPVLFTWTCCDLCLWHTIDKSTISEHPCIKLTSKRHFCRSLYSNNNYNFATFWVISEDGCSDIVYSFLNAFISSVSAPHTAHRNIKTTQIDTYVYITDTQTSRRRSWECISPPSDFSVAL